MAEGVHYIVSSDINVTMFNGASPFEEFEGEIGALLRARPGLSAQQKKDLVFRNLGRDVRSELSCQPEKGTAEELLHVLKEIYGDRRPLNTLALEFYGCRQDAYETLRHYIHRLMHCYRCHQPGHFARECRATVPRPASSASEGGESDSVIRNATGRVMRWSVRIDGKEALALVDTGSEVTTVSQAYFDQNRDHFPLRPKSAWFRMVAANTQSVPYSGYLVVDVIVGEEVIPDSVVFVVAQSTEECILGMNILRKLKNSGLGTFSSPESFPLFGPKPVRTLNTSTHIPPRSTQIVTVTGTDPSLLSDVLVEPLDSSDKHIDVCLLRTTTTSRKGRMQVLITNPTEMDTTIPPRTRVGVASEVITTPVTVQLENSRDNQPDFSRLHLP